jgi:hypothetical protein
MEDDLPFNVLLKPKLERLNLSTEGTYDMVKTVKGVQQVRRVGKFVGVYRMGSGDGMTVQWEFNLDGQKIVVEDDMWGSVSGSELVCFRRVAEAT